MDSYYFNKFNEDTRNLVARIEECCGEEVSIEVWGKSHFGCRIDIKNPCIIAPSLNKLPDDSVVHELFHLERFFVQSQPILEPGTHPDIPIEFEEALTKIDNQIEHLTIVPKEIQLWPHRKGYWGKVMHKIARELPSRSLSERENAGYLLLGWLFVNRVVPSSKLCRIWRALGNEFGIAGEVERFRELFDEGSKPDFVAALMGFFGVPEHFVELKSYDVTCRAPVVSSLRAAVTPRVGR